LNIGLKVENLHHEMTISKAIQENNNQHGHSLPVRSGGHVTKKRKY